MLVAVLGCHGSGKSTLVGAVGEQLHRRGVPVSCCYLGRAQDPRLLAQLRPAIESFAHRLVARRVGDGTDPDPVAGSRLHTLAAWWYALNLAIRFHRGVRPRLRRGGVVVVDRYVDDLAVMPGAPPGSLALARRLVRRPEVLVHVETPLATVAARRPEQPAARLAFEMAGFRQVCADQPPGVAVHRISGENDQLGCVVDEVVALVTDRLRYRPAAGRHRSSHRQ
ncbi:MAG TPA: hypothetical protein VK906_07020 [Egicoccus sp.]|nr:hypothetical protein [Egicoccus sp.]HSK22907.1 hypothetical protein [Egicoccus sp.]